MQQQYLTLINGGYSLRKKVYEHSYFDDTDTQEESFNNEPDIPDSEEILEMLAEEENGVKNSEETLSALFFRLLLAYRFVDSLSSGRTL